MWVGHVLVVFLVAADVNVAKDHGDPDLALVDVLVAAGTESLREWRKLP